MNTMQTGSTYLCAHRAATAVALLRRLLTGAVFVSCAAAVFAADSIRPAIIPQPQKLEVCPGSFHLRPETRIFADSGSLQTARQLAERLRIATGYPFLVERGTWVNGAATDGIWLRIETANSRLGSEGYELRVGTNSTSICAPAQPGLFYGVQTFLQLLPPQIFSSNSVSSVDWQSACVRIEDWPRFKWRGLMLDVSRHFFAKREVEKFLDEMALYKLNTFHWHLVDDQGWRIEIKKYPKLTQIGAWRKQSDLARPLNAKGGTNAHPAWLAAPASAYGPDNRYGGYYTQEDVREIVRYAAARHITVVPEIEMPGHSTAALAAYPQLSCFGGPYSTDVGAGVQEGIYCPANPETFTFLESVLGEVAQLFPGKYIHIGGDEVRKEYWSKSPECQALMRREGLSNEAELQSWFIKRIEKYVGSQGKTLIGWSEILQGGLAKNAVVMDWIGGGREAASEGHDVVMTPTGYCYFNYYQTKERNTEPHAQGGYLPLHKAYSFEPVPKELAPDCDSHIIGAQACLWTEWIASLPHAEYMLFPRLCALSEVVWSSKRHRSWEDFLRRVAINEHRLDQLNINYHQTATKIGGLH